METEVLNLNSKTSLKCIPCEKCCKCRGDIKLTPINVIEISNFLKISIEEFLEKYTYELENEEPEIAIKAVDKEKWCIFNDTETYKCKIQKYKPMQCVVFPLVPVDIDNDLFINSNQCKLENTKKISVNKWLNGNNKIYKRNKEIYMLWIRLMEELQPKWKNLSKENQIKIKNILFREYKKGNYKNQIKNNIKEVRKIIYNV